MGKERGITATWLAAVLTHEDAVNRLCLANHATALVIALDGLGRAGCKFGAIACGRLDSRGA